MKNSGSYCKANKKGCRKPRVEIQVPWDKTPSLPSFKSQADATFTDDMLLTEEYIRSEHGAVIDGITSIYETLRSMAYIERSEIKYPPHQNLPTAKLAAIGLEPEARALLRYLTYLDVSYDEGIEISRDTNAYTYLDDVDEAREVLWEGGNDLAPWTIRLSHGRVYPTYHGRTIIYDLRTKRITQWPHNKGGYTNTYLDLPSSTPEEAFGRWILNLRELKEIPWRNGKERHVKSEPPAPPWNYIDLIAGGYIVPEEGQVFNIEYKEVLRKSGWPDNFNIKRFRERRRNSGLGYSESESDSDIDSD